MYEEAKKKAAILIEALPYIKKFKDKVVVVKYGGNAMINEELKKAVFQDIVMMKLVGMKPVLVHGGGPEITDMLKRLGKETKFINGYRYTDREVLEVAEMVLVGKINKEIVASLNYYGGNALGMCGKDGSMITAEKFYPVVYDENGEESKVDIGFVGKVTKVDNTVLLDALKQDYIPVIAPVATNDKLTENKKFASRVCFTDSFQGEVVANYALKDLNLKTAVVVVDQAQVYSLGLAKAFKESFTKNGFNQLLMLLSYKNVMKIQEKINRTGMVMWLRNTS